MNKIGKNFSTNNLGQRKKSDFYETPYSITKQFIDLGCFDNIKSILEPACGDGAITKVLKDCNFSNITEYDIEKNFLTEDTQFDQIITNPPFSLAAEFILHAKKIAKERIAFLLPLSYLHGKYRHDYIWSDTTFKLKSVYVFTRYPLLGDKLREDGRYKTGMMVYAWYLWEKTYEGIPQLHWLDNNMFVLNSNKKTIM